MRENVVIRLLYYILPFLLAQRFMVLMFTLAYVLSFVVAERYYGGWNSEVSNFCRQVSAKQVNGIHGG